MSLKISLPVLEITASVIVMAVGPRCCFYGNSRTEVVVGAKRPVDLDMQESNRTATWQDQQNGMRSVSVLSDLRDALRASFRPQASSCEQ